MSPEDVAFAAFEQELAMREFDEHCRTVHDGGPCDCADDGDAPF